MLRRSLPFLFRRINQPPPCVCSVGLVRFGSYRDELKSTTDVGVANYPTQPQKREKDDEAHSLRAMPTKAIGNNAAGFNVFDLNAYPPYTKALDAYVRERLSSLGPVWSKDAQMDFRVFALAWRTATARAAKKNQDWSTCDKVSMMNNFEFVLRLNPASIEQQADELLGKMLGNTKYPPRMRLVGREKAMFDLASFCVSHLGNGKGVAGRGESLERRRNSIIYAPSTAQMPGLMTLFSTKGSGKTQLLKRVLFDVAVEQLAGGYVLVCDCYLNQGK